jgi:hypothetical protein
MRKVQLVIGLSLDCHFCNDMKLANRHGTKKGFYGSIVIYGENAVLLKISASTQVAYPYDHAYNVSQ